MVTTSFTSLRRLSKGALTLLLPAGLCAGLAAQQIPSVVSSSPVAVPHTESYGAPWQDAVSNIGDFVLFDFKSGGVYQYPANGGPEITIGAPNKYSGGFTDSGVAIDPRNNNLYLNNNYNGGLQELPFDAATGTWDLPPIVVANGLNGFNGVSGVTCGNYYQSAGMAMNDNGVLAVATENGCGVEIFTVPVDASGNFGTATVIVSNMSQRAKTVSIDDAGNISFNEDAGGLTGAYFIPAGTAGLTTDKGIARIDPNLGNVQGVANDRAGNIYVADGSAGVYLVPLMSGYPNNAEAVLLTTAQASGNASLDQNRGILFYPTPGVGSIKDVVKVYLNRVELGNAEAGAKTGNSGSVGYTFNAAATPYNFVVVQDGVAGKFTVGDLSGCGISFNTVNGLTTETATGYKAGATCTVPVTFTPAAAGDASATLLMLDAKNDVLNTTVLHGVGTSSNTLVAPATESRITSALKTPSQVATDPSGALYIADSGLGKVLQYAKGSGPTSTGVSIGTGLTAPTGVAVDGSGDVFIADSGSVLEIPYGLTGLNAAGQSTVKSGLGTNLKLATDAIGDIFIADPDNQRVVRLRNIVDGYAETDFTGFSQLSAIAVDGSGDFYVANGTALVEISTKGQQTLLNSLSNVTGLAVDASGAVYVTSTGGTVRIPSQGGTLSTANQVALAAGVTKPASVALDAAGNAYVADASAENIDFVSLAGSINLGTLATLASTSTGTVSLVNNGNVPLNITAFSKTPDYTVTSNTCIGAPIAVGASCTATITFSAGPGDQGTLPGQILVTTDSVSSPAVINITGVGAQLAASTSTITVTSPSVTTDTVVVKVVSTSGTGPVPTGNATVTVTGTGFTPIVTTVPLVNGTVTIQETTVPAGADTFTVNYGGDRVYGTSTATTKVTVAAGLVTLMQPANSTVPAYVLSDGNGSAEPYDGSQQAYYYTYLVTVHTVNGAPLIGQPVYDSNGKLTGYDYGSISFYDATGTLNCAPVEVGSDGTAPFGTYCVNINTSNNQIPNTQTSFTLTPTYNGNTDPNYATVKGTPFSFIALRNPSVVIASNPATINVAAGSTATASLTLTSLLGYGVTGVNSNLNNYSLPVELECDALPAHATCSFSYPTPDPSDVNSVDVTPTTPGKVTMTINTNIAVGTSTASLHTSRVIFAAMFGFSLLGLAFGKRKLRARLFQTLGLFIFCATVAGISSCSTTNISPNPVLTTPKGSYVVTVTAKQTGSKVIPGAQPGTTQTVYGNGNLMSVPFTVNVTVQ